MVDVGVQRRKEDEAGEDRCWPLQACFNSLIRRERQGAENNRAFSHGTFQSSSSSASCSFQQRVPVPGRGGGRSKDPEEVFPSSFLPFPCSDVAAVAGFSSSSSSRFASMCCPLFFFRVPCTHFWSRCPPPPSLPPSVP